MITSGDPQTDNTVPSENWLQQRYGITRNTARHAAQVQEVVYTVPGRGTYVSPR